jgi:hypothetical protein
MSASVGGCWCSGAACAAVACSCDVSFLTDRLVRVPRLADRSLGPAGVPGEAALIVRSDLDTIRRWWWVVKGKNTICSGWSSGATATCCNPGIMGCPRSIHVWERFAHAASAVFPPSCGVSPPRGARLPTGCTQNRRSIVAPSSPFSARRLSPRAGRILVPPVPRPAHPLRERRIWPILNHDGLSAETRHPDGPKCLGSGRGAQTRAQPDRSQARQASTSRLGPALRVV